MMPLYFFLIRKIVDVPIRSHLKQYIPAFVSSLIMVFAVFAFRYFIGQNFSITVRLVILVLAGAVTYLLAIRIIRPALYTKMLELAKMVLPGFLVRKIKPKIN
jgi:membrane protein YdbS with pleckstrin-like domain